MGAVLLDTTVLIDALRGRRAAGRILELLREGDTPFVCAVNVEELYRGLRRGEERHADRLIAGLGEALLGSDEGRRAGQWRLDHAAQGRTLSQADCLVAAAAHALGARLATGNPKDFPMEELTVEHWPAGE